MISHFSKMHAAKLVFGSRWYWSGFTVRSIKVASWISGRSTPTAYVTYDRITETSSPGGYVVPADPGRLAASAVYPKALESSVGRLRADGRRVISGTLRIPRFGPGARGFPHCTSPV